MMETMKFSHTIAALVLVLLTSLALSAQTVSQQTKSEPQGKLSGLILDVGDARVPRAKIVVEREGFRREAIAADDGSYEIELPVNSYTLTATGYGSQPTREAGVQIRADTVTSLNLVVKWYALEEFGGVEELSTETAVPNNTIELKKPKAKPKPKQ
jgi:Carboxypeptidase regulatory-like domain